MRGWKHLGSYSALNSTWQRQRAEELPFDDSDVIAFSYSDSSKTLRRGFVRGRELSASFCGAEWKLVEAVTGLCWSDHVWKATPLGEDCFK